MGDRQAKDSLFDAFGEVAKALGNGRRAELVDVLVQGERHVDELAMEIGQTLANTSFHLRVLAGAGLVTTRRDGTRIYYRLEQIGRNELAERLAAGDVVVVDVRPAAEFAAGHIAGARSIPIHELAANISALPAGIEVVAYCRGPYCVFADDAVRLLHRQGRLARRLEDGFPEWQRADLPVDTAVAS